MIRFLSVTVAIIFLGTISPGCSRSLPADSVPVFPVSGALTYHGQPMHGAVITFRSIDTKLTAQATADDLGEYVLTTYLTGDGAAAGEYAVTIHWPLEVSKTPTDDPDPQLPPDRLQQTYTNPKTSRLRATILEDSNTIDFKLP